MIVALAAAAMPARHTVNQNSHLPLLSYELLNFELPAKRGKQGSQREESP